MVFGHNLQHMAPFGIPNTGFCMVFRHANLLFSGSGMIFGSQDPEFVPRMCRLGWGPFWAKNGARKKMVLWKKWFPNGRFGKQKGGNEAEGIRTHMGRPLSPRPRPKKWFSPEKSKTRKPLGPLWGSLLALGGPAGSAAWPKAYSIS